MPSPLSHYCLQALHPLFGPGQEPGVRDNAAGAVARLLSTFGAHLPLEQVREDSMSLEPSMCSCLFTEQSTAKPQSPAVRPGWACDRKCNIGTTEVQALHPALALVPTLMPCLPVLLPLNAELKLFSAHFRR